MYITVVEDSEILMDTSYLAGKTLFGLLCEHVLSLMFIGLSPVRKFQWVFHTLAQMSQYALEKKNVYTGCILCPCLTKFDKNQLLSLSVLGLF